MVWYRSLDDVINTQLKIARFSANSDKHLNEMKVRNANDEVV